jgi:hypothetical protein
MMVSGVVVTMPPHPPQAIRVTTVTIMVTRLLPIHRPHRPQAVAKEAVQVARAAKVVVQVVQEAPTKARLIWTNSGVISTASSAVCLGATNNPHAAAISPIGIATTRVAEAVVVFSRPL